jgi:hypothetical protein
VTLQTLRFLDFIILSLYFLLQYDLSLF